ncbi:MAG: hypothetical protein WC455_22375 [Dehalococcoidia bacterium]|jgi:hypothetical protein
MTIRDLTTDELTLLIKSTVKEAFEKCPLGVAHARQIKRLQVIGVAILFGLLLTHPVEVKQVFELLK